MFRVAYVPGVFDLLHQGHLSLLRAARRQCERLVVAVISDEGAAAYKRPPVQDEQTRLEVIRALRIVDHAVIQPTTDPTPILEVLRPRPDVLFHGDDWDRLREGHDRMLLLGVEFRLLPYTIGVSTSVTIARIVERWMVTA